MAEMDISLARDLALACNILAMYGHNDLTLGHVTARRPGQTYLHMKAAGLGLEEVTPQDIILIDLDGKKLLGNGARHLEYPIHTEIYKMYKNINCVIHTHPLFATVLGAAGHSIKPLSNEGVLFVDLPIFTDTTELITTPDQGQAVARHLDGHRALLLQNHGVVVTGTTIQEATIYALLLEKAATLQVIANSFGGFSYSSVEETKRKVGQIYHAASIQSFWDYCVRKLRKRNSDRCSLPA